MYVISLSSYAILIHSITEMIVLMEVRDGKGQINKHIKCIFFASLSFSSSCVYICTIPHSFRQIFYTAYNTIEGAALIHPPHLPFCSSVQQTWTLLQETGRPTKGTRGRGLNCIVCKVTGGGQGVGEGGGWLHHHQLNRDIGEFFLWSINVYIIYLMRFSFLLENSREERGR